MAGFAKVDVAYYEKCWVDGTLNEMTFNIAMQTAQQESGKASRLMVAISKKAEIVKGYEDIRDKTMYNWESALRNRLLDITTFNETLNDSFLELGKAHRAFINAQLDKKYPRVEATFQRAQLVHSYLQLVRERIQILEKAGEVFKKPPPFNVQ